MENRNSLVSKLGLAVLFFLVFSAVYLYAFPQANLVYPAVVLAHAGLGLIATVGVLWKISQAVRRNDWSTTVGWLVLAIGGVVGVLLTYKGTSRPEFRLLHIHILASLAGVVLLLAFWLQSRKKASGYDRRKAFSIAQHWRPLAFRVAASFQIWNRNPIVAAVIEFHLEWSRITHPAGVDRAAHHRGSASYYSMTCKLVGPRGSLSFARKRLAEADFAYAVVFRQHAGRTEALDTMTLSNHLPQYGGKAFMIFLV